MIIKEDYNTWGDLIEDFIHNGKSLAIGVFLQNGELIHANEAMCIYLDTDVSTLKPKNAIVNPEFNLILESNENGELFSGLMTIGNYSDVSYVLEAKVVRREKKLMVIAEANTHHLFNENKKMSHLNQEVNNLQRQIIKEKKTLELTLKELKETQQMLIHSEKMNALGKLVAGVAHEINNPIAFVYSNLFSLEENTNDLVNSYMKVEQLIGSKEDTGLNDMLNKIKDEDEINYVIDDITNIIKESKTGIERVKKIVENLRTFSRLDESDLKRVDLIETVRSTISIADMQIKEKNINFSFLAPSELIIECFPGQLNQALLNVIINAIQAVDAGGDIVLSIRENSSSVAIEIKDNGCGIPEENMSKVFDPFFTTKPVGEGTGLGLSITYKIIKALHKGSISVDSVLGDGAIFSLFLPKIMTPK